MKKRTRRALVAAIKKLNASTAQADAALARALAYIERSEQIISAWEVAARAKKKPSTGYPPLSAQQLAAIRKGEPKRRGRVVSSLLTKK